MCVAEPLSLSPEEAADYIGLSKPTIYRLLAAGSLKGKRVGSRTLIDGKSVRAFYASLPDYVAGASIPNAPHVLSGKPSRRQRRRGA
jgi:excisionase family DNA binding protein